MGKTVNVNKKTEKWTAYSEGIANVTFDSDCLEQCEQYWYLGLRMKGKESKNKEQLWLAMDASRMVDNEARTARHAGP